VPHFSSHGVDIAYRDIGAGDPILLIHGFASNTQVNWVFTSWTETLAGDGRRVIAMDVRGHGASGKLYQPSDYRPAVMAADGESLLDHLAVARADVMGYSMGARIAARLAIDHPDRVRSLIIGGMGMNLVAGMADQEEIAAALESESDTAALGDAGRAYRAFAVRTGGDLKALAACMRGQRVTIPAAELAGIRAPALVAVGSEDSVAGSPAALAALIPGGRAFVIPGRDHMSATGDKRFKAAVLDFLRRRP
jgi:pimeloyl-ACP methyl ester carboxylesterase